MDPTVSHDAIMAEWTRLCEVVPGSALGTLAGTAVEHAMERHGPQVDPDSYTGYACKTCSDCCYGYEEWPCNEIEAIANDLGVEL